MIPLILTLIVVFIVGVMWGMGINRMIHDWRKRKARAAREARRRFIALGYLGAPLISKRHATKTREAM